MISEYVSNVDDGSGGDDDGTGGDDDDDGGDDHGGGDDDDDDGDEDDGDDDDGDDDGGRDDDDDDDNDDNDLFLYSIQRIPKISNIYVISQFVALNTHITHEYSITGNISEQIHIHSYSYSEVEARDFTSLNWTP